MNIRIERNKIRLSKMKEHLENCEQPTGLYQTIEFQQEMWNLKRRITLLENAIRKAESKLNKI